MRSPSGWTSISHTNPWSQHYPEQIYQQNGPQRSLRTLTLSSINIIILLLIIVIIIIINTLIIIIIWSYSSTAAAEEASSSSVPSLLSSHQHLHTIIIFIIKIITEPFSPSSSSSPSLLQLFGTKTCWKRGGVYAIFGGIPLLFYFTIYKSAPA